MLESYLGFQTGDTGQLRAALIADLGATYFDVPAANGGFKAEVHWAKRADLTIVSATCNRGTEVSYPAASFVRQYFEMSPRASLRFGFGRRSTELSSSSAPVIVAAETAYRIEATADHNLLVVRIEQDLLNRKLEAMLGEPIASDVRFDEAAARPDSRQQSLRQAVIQFASDLDLLGPDMPSLARADLEQVLIDRFLLCNEHNFSGRLSSHPPPPSLSQLKRVESYIEAHWDKPFDIDALARVSNVSARTIFRYFKNIRGVSPRDFARNVRLKHARHLFETAAPNASVMAIAMKCGFQSLGHFSRDYREAFGELPSETLRRARAPTKG